MCLDACWLNTIYNLIHPAMHSISTNNSRLIASLTAMSRELFLRVDYSSKSGANLQGNIFLLKFEENCGLSYSLPFSPPHTFTSYRPGPRLNPTLDPISVLEHRGNRAPINAAAHCSGFCKVFCKVYTHPRVHLMCI